MCQQRASCQTSLDRLDKERRQLQQAYKDQGGSLYDQRAQISADHEKVKGELMIVHDRLREVAAGDAPLLLVVDQLTQAYEQCIIEKSLVVNTNTLTILQERDHDLVSHLAQSNVDTYTITTIASYLESDRVARETNDLGAPIIGVDPAAFEILHSGRLDEVRESVEGLISRSSELQEELLQIERRLESIPDPAGLEGISRALSDNEKRALVLRHELTALSQRYDQVILAMQKKQTQIDTLLDSHLRSQFASESSRRVVSQAKATRSLLAEYRKRMCGRHISRLENLILESYQLLLRKQSLVHDFKIDLETFEPTLHASTGDQVPLDRLSAGERQLLAVAILWGLSKASGRPLPTVIDTPLGRLDGGHRDNLVKSYFPAASHQVILLSTDEEIDKRHHAVLRPALGREYSIRYDEATQASAITEGYFWKGAA